MKYVVCIPDGCADLPVPELGGRTPLEAANTPNLDALAARGTRGDVFCYHRLMFCDSQLLSRPAKERTREKSEK